jgi:hypothetical protein
VPDRIRRGVACGARHHEPPEVAWLPPELEVGAEPWLKPLELELSELELPELDEDEFELVDPEPEAEEPEFDDPEADDPLPDDPELVEDEPEFPEVDPVPDEPADVVVLCDEPGKTRATTPATATLATLTTAVVERTLARPCSLAAAARRMPSRCALLMFVNPVVRYSGRSARTFSVASESSGLLLDG